MMGLSPQKKPRPWEFRWMGGSHSDTSSSRFSGEIPKNYSTMAAANNFDKSFKEMTDYPAMKVKLGMVNIT